MQHSRRTFLIALLFPTEKKENRGATRRVRAQTTTQGMQASRCSPPVPANQDMCCARGQTIVLARKGAGRNTSQTHGESPPVPSQKVVVRAHLEARYSMTKIALLRLAR